MSYVYSESKIDLIINKVSRAIYKQLQDNGDISENEIYLITDPILDAADDRILNTADPIDGTDAANKQYVDKNANDAFLSSKAYINEEISSYALKDNISVGYDPTTQKITLDADGNISEIDATNFIKDGMLSAVSYDKSTNKLVLSFNTDAGISPISVSLSSLVDVYTAGNGLTAVNNQFRINENIVTTKTVAAQISSDLNQKVKNKVTFRYWSEA